MGGIRRRRGIGKQWGGGDGLKGEKLNGEKVINIIIKGVNGNV